MHTLLQELVSSVGNESIDVGWSICLRDRVGSELAAHHADRPLSTASVGKLLLLVEVARQYEIGSLEPEEMLRRGDGISVSDSGLWQHLTVDALSVDDLAVLTSSVSDNLATNVLLERVGLDQVRKVAEYLGLKRTMLLDRVRDRRGSNDPSGLSTGSAGELSGLMGLLCRGEAVSPFVSEKVVAWLGMNADLSMVVSSFGSDPLSHVKKDRDVLLRNKTGTDRGVRVDTGFTAGPSGTVAYAVLANWNESTRDSRDLVLEDMRRIGAKIREVVGS